MGPVPARHPILMPPDPELEAVVDDPTLAEVELAEQVQHHLQRMLDGFGGVRTGVAPLDWLAEG